MTVNMATWGIWRFKTVDPIGVNNFTQSTQSQDGPNLRSKDKVHKSSLIQGVIDLADSRLQQLQTLDRQHDAMKESFRSFMTKPNIFCRILGVDPLTIMPVSEGLLRQLQ
jgi:hypothetical protein